MKAPPIRPSVSCDDFRQALQGPTRAGGRAWSPEWAWHLVRCAACRRELVRRPPSGSGSPASDAGESPVGLPPPLLARNRFVLAPARLLGRGRDGWVYRGTDRANRSAPVAVKFARGGEGTAAARMRAEATLQRAIRSPHVAGVIATGIHRDGAGSRFPFVVVECLDGPDLEAFALDTLAALPQRDGERWAIGVAEQLAAALADCHEAGVAHADLGPRNAKFLHPLPAGRPAVRAAVKLLDFSAAIRLPEAGVARDEATRGELSRLGVLIVYLMSAAAGPALRDAAPLLSADTEGLVGRLLGTSGPPFPSAAVAREELSLLIPRRRTRRLAAAVVAVAAVAVAALSSFWASDRSRLAAVEQDFEGVKRDVMRQGDLVAAERQQSVRAAAGTLHWLDVQARPAPKDDVRAKIARDARELELKLDAMARTAVGGPLGGKTVAFGRTVIALARGDPDAAIRLTADWQAAAPVPTPPDAELDSRAFQLRGQAYLEKRAWGDAEACFDRALSLRPGDERLTFARGWTRFAGGNDDVGADADLAAVEAGAGGGDARLAAIVAGFRGDIAQRAGRAAAAEAAFGRAVAALDRMPGDPADPDRLFWRAVFSFNRAVAARRAAAAIRPEDSRCYADAADACRAAAEALRRPEFRGPAAEARILAVRSTPLKPGKVLDRARAGARVAQLTAALADLSPDPTFTNAEGIGLFDRGRTRYELDEFEEGERDLAAAARVFDRRGTPADLAAALVLHAGVRTMCRGADIPAARADAARARDLLRTLARTAEPPEYRAALGRLADDAQRVIDTCDRLCQNGSKK